MSPVDSVPVICSFHRILACVIYLALSSCGWSFLTVLLTLRTKSESILSILQSLLLCYHPLGVMHRKVSRLNVLCPYLEYLATLITVSRSFFSIDRVYDSTSFPWNPLVCSSRHVPPWREEQTSTSSVVRSITARPIAPHVLWLLLLLDLGPGGLYRFQLFSPKGVGCWMHTVDLLFYRRSRLQVNHVKWCPWL